MKSMAQNHKNWRFMKTTNGKHATSHFWLARLAGAVLGILIIGVGFIPMPEIRAYIWDIAIPFAIVLAAIVTSFFWKDYGVTPVRWMYRTAGAILGVVLVTIFLGDVVGGHGPPIEGFVTDPRLVFLLVVFIGLVVMFFQEGIGGALISIAVIAELIVSFSSSENINPFIVQFLPIGLASVYCWWRTIRLSRSQQAK